MKRETLVEVFSTNLREARKRCGLTQADLAAKAGVTQAYISLLEAGNNPPTLDLLAPLAEALGLTPKALLDAEIFFAKSA